jgi:hypothetical protein
MRLARLSRRRPEPGSGTATRTLLPVRATYRFRPQRPSNSRREVGKGEPRGESSAKVPGGPERGQAGTGPSALRLLPGALHRRDVGGLAAKGNPDHGGRPGGPPDSLHRDLRHRPAYSTGYHEGESELASVLNGFGDRLTKYVLNLNGHSHDYERYRPIHGVVHITATGGGADLETPWQGDDARTAYRAMHLAHLRVDVTPGGIHTEAVCGPPTSDDDVSCRPGEVIDAATISARG